MTWNGCSRRRVLQSWARPPMGAGEGYRTKGRLLARGTSPRHAYHFEEGAGADQVRLRVAGLKVAFLQLTQLAVQLRHGLGGPTGAPGSRSRMPCPQRGRPIAVVFARGRRACCCLLLLLLLLLLLPVLQASPVVAHLHGGQPPHAAWLSGVSLVLFPSDLPSGTRVGAPLGRGQSPRPRR